MLWWKTYCIVLVGNFMEYDAKGAAEMNEN